MNTGSQHSPDLRSWRLPRARLCPCKSDSDGHVACGQRPRPLSLNPQVAPRISSSRVAANDKKAGVVCSVSSWNGVEKANIQDIRCPKVWRLGSKGLASVGRLWPLWLYPCTHHANSCGEIGPRRTWCTPGCASSSLDPCLVESASSCLGFIKIFSQAPNRCRKHFQNELFSSSVSLTRTQACFRCFPLPCFSQLSRALPTRHGNFKPKPSAKGLPTGTSGEIHARSRPSELSAK